MWQEAEGAIWRWVTDAKGERVRLPVTCARREVIAAAGRPGMGWLQLLPVDGTGALSPDPPEMIAAVDDVVGAITPAAESGPPAEPHAAAPRLPRGIRRLRPAG